MFYEKIKAYRKKRNKEDQSLEWAFIADFWMSFAPCEVTYPLKRNGQERYEGEAYLVITAYDERIFEIDKIVFKDKDFFFFCTPKVIGKTGDLTFKIFSWSTGAGNNV